MAEKKKSAAKGAAKKKTAPKKPEAKKQASKKTQTAKTAPKGTGAQNEGPEKGAAKAPPSGGQAQPGTAQQAGRQGSNLRPTVSHMLGEIVWLLSQSKPHRQFTIADLDWMVAPAIANSQYRVFRADKKPVGVALWAYVNDEANTKLTSGTGRLRPDEWKSGEHLWLIEVIAPFANSENKLTEAMFADLVNGPLKGKKFRFSKVNPDTGKREVAEFTPKEQGG